MLHMSHLISSGAQRVFNYSALDSGITFPDKTAGGQQLSKWIRLFPPHQPHDREPFCHTEVILNELIRVCGERFYLDLPQAFGAREEEGRLLSSAANISHIFPIQSVSFSRT